MKESAIAVAGFIRAPLGAGVTREAAAAGSVTRASAWPGTGTATAGSAAEEGAAVSGSGRFVLAPAGCGVFDSAGVVPPGTWRVAGSEAAACVGAAWVIGSGFEIASGPAGELPVMPEGNAGKSSAAGGKGSVLVFESAPPGAPLGRGGRSSGANATVDGAASPAGETGCEAGALASASACFGSDSEDDGRGSGGNVSDVVPWGGPGAVAEGVTEA
jgi:hypothetical protein